MKKMIHTSLAVLLLSATVTTACMAPNGASVAAPVNVPVASEKASLEGPRDAKELEAFADGVFADKMKKYNTVGSNFVVVAGGKVMLSKGYGYADKGKKIPVDKNTVFQIGSVTKSFTALAAMQLVDKGKMDLKRDIQEYLGGIKVPNKTGKKLTMFDLLTYSSGFDEPDISMEMHPEYADKYFPMKKFIASNMPTVVRTPGEAYTYDNFGFMLAGYAVANVTGMSYSKYMEKNIFKPLGMNSTNVRFTPQLLSRMAAHYGPTGELIPLDGFKPTEKPEGGIVSTADDMAKYLIMHLNKGKYKGKEVVSPKSIEQMHTYQLFPDKEFPVTTIGFEGYFKEKMNNQHVILKGGNVTGHSSLIVILPEKNTAMYMSYNNDSMMSLDVYEEFMNHYYPRKSELPKSTYATISEQQAQDYVGLYQNTRIAALRTKVSYSDGKLIMETGTSGKHTLKMIHPLLFEDESGNKLTFNKNQAGHIAYLYYMQLPDLVAYAQKINIDSPFSDVPADSKYIPYINNLNALKVMSGKSAHLFDPKGTMTQREFSEVLLRAHGWYKQPFMIEPNTKQMMAGLRNYQPNSPITRQMAAVMIQNLKQVEPGIKVKLGGETDAWAVKAITALVSQGIMDPNTKINLDGSIDFRSKQLLKRQEASALLDQAFNYYTLPISH
ncbi:serine hydrolase [Paenibacillus sp. FSL M8-0228]|uniref:serine hydrolase n=1 Tax=Paenibacillus TaxID=44249 RepID=UPI0003FD2D41|nr:MULTISPECIES: serine hydrolase [Paenibacillus]MBO3284833.1 serine hydrolase [Paenibacillus polymyxa]MBP1311886.1 CubicO group peptidase (beta-lactamase class C family) [Paenibacillus sp. 1182]ODB53746.1 penicillin-binding protein [Paenibacillus polymyxa]UMY54851.1 serine hydrolase [Paenibacillus peoriae]